MTSSSRPTIMKVVHQPDPKSSHLTLDHGPLPTPSSPDDYLIQVKATSPCLNELTWETQDPHLFPADRERVPGTECAGVVVSGPTSGRFSPGDAVFFRSDAWQTGCLREYTLQKESYIALKPKTLGWVEAAATPLSALTAWQGLFVNGTLAAPGEDALRKNGQMRVLITGAGGGVGSWAVQLAAAAGVGAIVGVCSTSKVDDVKRLGASEVIDYKQQSIDSWVAQDPSARECDLILDCVAGATLAACWTAVKEGGTLLTIAGADGPIRPANLTKHVAKGEWYLVQSSGSDLAKIAELIDAGQCTPLVDSVFEFKDFEKAFSKVQEGHSRGKIVIKVTI